MAKADLRAPKDPAAQALSKGAVATRSSRYLLPLATAVFIGACYEVYSLTYVQQHREFLLNRNYRVLATLGDQMSETLANQASVLTSYINSFDGGEFSEGAGPRPKTLIKTSGGEQPYQPERLSPFELTTLIRQWAPRLTHVTAQVAQPEEAKRRKATPEELGLILLDGEWSFQLHAVATKGNHEVGAAIGMRDVALSFSPSSMEVFDDVLVENERNEIVYQSRRIGPRFSSLSELVKNATPTPGDAGKADASDADGGTAHPRGSGQLIETDLAGVPYMVFFEPVTIDVSPDQKRPQRFTIFGLVPSRQFRWQCLAISFNAIIFFSSSFLLLCLSAPIMKILFLNERGRHLLHEIVLSPLLLVVIAGALTSICMQTICFNLGPDAADQELKHLSEQMRGNVKRELTAMRNQLTAVCGNSAFTADRHRPESVVRENVLSTELRGSTLEYPYFNTVFWTLKAGWQEVKWATAENASPLIDVSRFDFFRKLTLDNHYYFLDEKRPPFRFDSFLPPNQDSYVGVLGMRVSDCAHDGSKDEFVFLVAPALSLIDPILPLGVGFALVDEKGQVLFHSDKYRNNRENLLVETGNDRELTASLYGHSNEHSFSLLYRGNPVLARLVPIPGVNQAPWSLFLYKEARYSETYDLEVLTMAGVLFICYAGIPAAVALLFYFSVRPRQVPGWLWPSQSAREIYISQIAAGSGMLALSCALIFLRPIEQSLYAAAACGYVTLMIVFIIALADRPESAGKRVFEVFSGLAAFAMAAFPVWKAASNWPEDRGWLLTVPIGLLFIPVAWLMRKRRDGPAAREWFPRLSYRVLFNIRALVLLSVVGILPPLSFFRNSMLLEERLQLRAEQLHAAGEWRSRERRIETLIAEVPDPAGDGKLASRCGIDWDSDLQSYYDTKARREVDQSQSASSGHLDPGFLLFAHFLHHSYNDIGAQSLGVLNSPALPESVYVSAKPDIATKSDLGPDRSAEPEWQWEWDPAGRVKLRVHEGAVPSNTCALPGEHDPDKNIKEDVVVSSAVPQGQVSAASNVFTWLAVAAVMSILFRLVTRKIFLLDLGEPLTQSAEELRSSLARPGNFLVLTASLNDRAADLTDGVAARINVRELASQPDWGEKFDAKTLSPAGPVVVEDFDWELGCPDYDRQRLVLTERLLAHPGKVILVSATDPSRLLLMHRERAAGTDASRWAVAIGAFTRINLRRDAVWEPGERIERESLLWRECSVQPELYRIAEDIGNEGKPEGLEDEQIVAEVGERAAQYYCLIWQSCTQEERFLLAGLAEDGMVNYRNASSLRQLLRRRLIVRAPQFRIMNESFRRFVLIHSASMRTQWHAEAAASGWGKARGSFTTAMVLIGVFLIATQQQFLQTSSGLLTAAGGCVGGLLQLIGAAQGRGSEK